MDETEITNNEYRQFVNWVIDSLAHTQLEHFLTEDEGDGVSERMLAQTLQWLEADGLVERRAFKVVPPHVEYELTPLGVEAAGHVAALAVWIEDNIGRMRTAG